LVLQNLLKVFNGYWRMEFPDWGRYMLDAFHQDMAFLPSSLFLNKETLFMIWRIIFDQEASFFNLKPPS